MMMMMMMMGGFKKETDSLQKGKVYIINRERKGAMKKLLLSFRFSVLPFSVGLVVVSIKLFKGVAIFSFFFETQTSSAFILIFFPKYKNACALRYCLSFPIETFFACFTLLSPLSFPFHSEWLFYVRISLKILCV